MRACNPQRASEVAKADPKIAYYCRLYAMSQVRWSSWVWRSIDTACIEILT